MVSIRFGVTKSAGHIGQSNKTGQADAVRAQARVDTGSSNLLAVEKGLQAIADDFAALGKGLGNDPAQHLDVISGVR
jgi:hypothetical protein